LSDPQDSSWSGSGRAGAWGGGFSGNVEALPSTSFGDIGEDRERRSSQHRRSYNDVPDWDLRGRRRESSGREGDSMFHFSSGSQFDPAGSEGLRHSRGFYKRDSHFAATLSSRAFHTSDQNQDDPTGRRPVQDEDVIPLDSENSTHAQSPQRASMGPDDELFAGESLALYAFEPLNPNELRLHEGQIILVSYRHGQGWLVAEDPATGEQGLVPEEYVRLVREIEAWDAERGTFIEEDGEGEGDGADMDESEELAGESSLPATAGREEDFDSGNSGEAVTDHPSKAMLAEPPDVDHEEGLQMDSSASASPTRGHKKVNWQQRERVEDERRQDSGHAEK
jgi:hypothetical protein